MLYTCFALVGSWKKIFSVGLTLKNNFCHLWSVEVPPVWANVLMLYVDKTFWLVMFVRFFCFPLSHWRIIHLSLNLAHLVVGWCAFLSVVKYLHFPVVCVELFNPSQSTSNLANPTPTGIHHLPPHIMSPDHWFLTETQERLCPEYISQPPNKTSIPLSIRYGESVCERHRKSSDPKVLSDIFHLKELFLSGSNIYI